MSDERFVQTIFQTVVFTVLAISIVISLSLFLSQIINARFKGRAIVRNPKMFLFDEPLSNLDAKLRVQ